MSPRGTVCVFTASHLYGLWATAQHKQNTQSNNTHLLGTFFIPPSDPPPRSTNLQEEEHLFTCGTEMKASLGPGPIWSLAETAAWKFLWWDSSWLLRFAACVNHVARLTDAWVLCRLMNLRLYIGLYLLGLVCMARAQKLFSTLAVLSVEANYRVIVTLTALVWLRNLRGLLVEQSFALD